QSVAARWGPGRLLCSSRGGSRGRSAFPADYPFRNRAEPAAGQSGRRERGMRPFKAVGRECPRAVESEERRVGRLRPRSVLAGALAERGRIAFDVEDVVDDLKRKAD